MLYGYFCLNFSHGKTRSLNIWLHYYDHCLLTMKP